MALEIKRNAFEALCELASSEGWCWNICCSTCGHMYFRYAFIELLLGKHPDSSTWITRQSNHHSLNSRLGNAVSDILKLDKDQQQQLIGIFAGASLTNLRRACRFPDWLGYMGLALLYTEEAEPEGRTLTKAWLPQLLEFIPSTSPTHETYKKYNQDNDQILTWRSLSGFERDIRAYKYFRAFTVRPKI